MLLISITFNVSSTIFVLDIVYVIKASNKTKFKISESKGKNTLFGCLHYEEI